MMKAKLIKRSPTAEESGSKLTNTAVLVAQSGPACPGPRDRRRDPGRDRQAQGLGTVASSPAIAPTPASSPRLMPGAGPQLAQASNSGTVAAIAAPAPSLQPGDRPQALGSKPRPSLKSLMAIELILTTFGPANVLKAIAEISGAPADQFLNRLPTVKPAKNRHEVLGHYRVFLQSFIAEYGAVAALEALLRAVKNRIQLNQRKEETQVFVGAWLGTRKVIRQTLAALGDSPQVEDDRGDGDEDEDGREGK